MLMQVQKHEVESIELSETVLLTSAVQTTPHQLQPAGEVSKPVAVKASVSLLNTVSWFRSELYKLYAHWYQASLEAAKQLFSQPDSSPHFRLRRLVLSPFTVLRLSKINVSRLPLAHAS